MPFAGSTYQNTRDDGIYMVACVIRNTGSGWFLLDDAGHKPLNVNSIAENTVSVILDFPVSNFIYSLVVTPDETYALQGINVGASVSTNQITIQFSDKDGNQISPSILTNPSGNFWVMGFFNK